MTEALPFQILPPPDDVACGPTCLHAFYRIQRFPRGDPARWRRLQAALAASLEATIGAR